MKLLTLIDKKVNDNIDLTLEELKVNLEDAIKLEDYEKASMIRDEINKRSKK